jgi:hypothetical protein
MQTEHSRRTYDHRIREAILETGDRNLYPELEIPQSTIRSWVHRGLPDVVTYELVNCDHAALISEMHALRQRTALLAAVVGLLAAMLRVSKNGLAYERYADGASKLVLLRAVDRASKVLPLSSTLRVARLSTSRYYSWRQVEDGCELDDQPSCPRVRPMRLTSQEVESMRTLAESSDHRHMSLRALALHAQRIGKLVASPSTWYRMARKLAWGRPRRRLYPAKPKMGIRASAPGELLHLDLTIIRLLDGTRAYLHAAIDNYSSRSSRGASRIGSAASLRSVHDRRNGCSRSSELTVHDGRNAHPTVIRSVNGEWINFVALRTGSTTAAQTPYRLPGFPCSSKIIRCS